MQPRQSACCSACIFRAGIVLILLLLLAFGLSRFSGHLTPRPDGTPQTWLNPPALTPQERELDRLFDKANEAYTRMDLKTAAALWQEGLTKAQTLADSRRIARFLNGLGNVYDDMKQFSKSQDYHTRALTIREKLGNQKDIGDSLTNLGILSTHLNHLDRAQDYFRRAEAIYEKLGYSQDIARCLTDLGTVYYKLRQWDKAKDCFNRALALFETLGDQQHIALNLNKLGNIYNDLGQWEKGLDYHNRARKIKQKLGQLTGQSLPPEQNAPGRK